ncbi:hypothetical protein BHM03_00011694 [Ensete ventricosum]|nr:hypothetical protein BHM03_00011694 [Ensete ventricosum]
MSATRSGSKKEMEWLRRFHLARESGRPLQPILESLPSRAKNRKRCGIALPEECVCVFGGTAQRVLPPLRLLLALLPPPFPAVLHLRKGCCSAETRAVEVETRDILKVTAVKG